MYHVMIIETTRWWPPSTAVCGIQPLVPDRAALFKSGTEALEYLKDHTTDLIILDYYTPLMNGDIFIDRLHAMGKTPAIIMVTSANDTDIVRSLLSRGVLDYLVKPFEYARFRTALERFAAQQEYLQGARPSLSQNAIDQLFAGPDPAGDSVPQLSKGLNEATLNMIRRFLAEHRRISLPANRSRSRSICPGSPIRRYMNYLVDIGEIVSSIDYKTGGRPSIQYSLGRRNYTL